MNLAIPKTAPDLARIRGEVGDLPFKKGYGMKFRMTISRGDYELRSPTLHIFFHGAW